MNIKTVSILGAGWLGFPLAQRLIDLGYQVKGSTTRPEFIEKIRASGVEPYLLSFDPDLYFEELDNPLTEFFSSDVLIINIPFRRDFPDPRQYYYQVKAIFPFIEKSCIRKIIFASSTSIYPEDRGLVDETYAINFGSERANVLFETEELVQACAKVDSVIVRFGGLYGGTRRIGQFLAGKECLPDPEKPVNLIHLDDCVNILTLIVENNVGSGVFNAVSDKHPTRKELYTKAAEHLNLNPPDFSGKDGSNYKVVSNAKLKQQFHYKFRWPDPLMSVSAQ